MGKWKQTQVQQEVYVSLAFEPGQDAQCDWGEAMIVLRGQEQKVQLFVMRLSYLRRVFVMAFPSQKQDCFLYGHVRAFRYFGGVLWRVSYDNVATAVRVLPGKERKRQENRTDVSFRSHYLFESHYCTPGQGHEKGGVEHAVGYVRRNFLVPMPHVESYEELNSYLLRRCRREDGRHVEGQEATIGEQWEQERRGLRPLPPCEYDCAEVTMVRVTPYSQATYETKRYSIPVKRGRRDVMVNAYLFHLELVDGNKVVAKHAWSYERGQDVFDPQHYLSLLKERPGAFDYAKPLRKWRKEWPECYQQMLGKLREKWPEGRGVEEFVSVLQLHQTYPANVVEEAVKQALEYGCVHSDGVLHCLHQLTRSEESPKSLDLSDRRHLQEVGNQPIDLSQYEQLLKKHW